MKKLIYISIISLFFISCNRIKDGYIIDKIYEPSQYYYVMVYDIPSNNYIEREFYKSSKWYLVIQKVVDNDTLTREIEVSEFCYHNNLIGEYINLE